MEHAWDSLVELGTEWLKPEEGENYLTTIGKEDYYMGTKICNSKSTRYSRLASSSLCSRAMASEKCCFPTRPLYNRALKWKSKV